MKPTPSLSLQYRVNPGFFLYNCGWLRDLLAEDMSLDKVRKPNGELIRDEALCWNRKHLCRKLAPKCETCLVLLTVNFLQSELLGLSDKAEDHEPSN